MSELLVRHARRLWSGGQVEEAADHLIEAGALDEAAEAVEAAGRTLLMRGDWEKLGGWCDALGEERLSRRPALRGLQLLAFQTDRRSELPGLVRRLMASGEYERLAREAPDAATTAVFGLHMSGDWEGVQRYLPPDEASPGARAMRYVLEVGCGADPPRPWRVADLDSVPYHVGLLQCGLYFQGRLDEVEAMARIENGAMAPARVTRTRLYSSGASAGGASLGDARMRFEGAGRTSPSPGSATSGSTPRASCCSPRASASEGLQRGARGAHARPGARPPAGRPCDLRGDRGQDAGADGAHGGGRRAAARRPRVVPRSACCPASASGRPRGSRRPSSSGATTRCPRRGCSSGRSPAWTAPSGAWSSRRPWCSMAEARWRLGDEDGHDAAAAAARAATEAMGSLGPLLTALQDAPDVLARCIDAGGPEAAGWRALARAGETSRTATSVEGARIVIGTLGRLRLDVDGTERHISPPRAIDVAAEVARAGMRGLSRERLVEVLAEHSIDAQNYLRQVIHRLRRVAPEGVELTSEDGLLRWTPAGRRGDRGRGAPLAARARRAGDRRGAAADPVRGARAGGAGACS